MYRLTLIGFRPDNLETRRPRVQNRYVRGFRLEANRDLRFRSEICGQSIASSLTGEDRGQATST